MAKRRIFYANIFEELRSDHIEMSRDRNDKERELASKILSLRKDLEAATLSEIFEDEELVCMQSEEEIDFDANCEPFSVDSGKELFDYVLPIKRVIYYKNLGRNSSSIQQTFRRVSHRQYIYRFLLEWERTGRNIA